MACGVETAASDTPLACTHLSLSLSSCRYFLRLSLSLSLDACSLFSVFATVRATPTPLYIIAATTTRYA